MRNYDLNFYEDAQGQVELLRTTLKEFREQGYKAREIAILSFRAPELSAAEYLRKEGFRLRPLWSSDDEIGYGSIHAFKGMESKIIILTDLLLEDAGMHRTLFYVGMTRATETVRILCDAKSMGTLSEWLAKKVLHA